MFVCDSPALLIGKRGNSSVGIEEQGGRWVCFFWTTLPRCSDSLRGREDDKEQIPILYRIFAFSSRVIGQATARRAMSLSH